ncbi:hypothetical protein GOODEAATRI_010141 [Goodea atripinnis]|uniref:Uncharacterized protein n=1 Tax=Goodea atripinnis TaxID=208336 RepID=A0ABV0MGM6_9TELE
MKGGQRSQVGEGLEKLLPAQLQQAGHSQPDLEQRASPLVLMDVHDTTVNIHAASLGRGQRLSRLATMTKKNVWKSQAEALKPTNTVPTVKRGGASIMSVSLQVELIPRTKRVDKSSRRTRYKVFYFTLNQQLDS